MRGRLPSGPECVNKLAGDALAKERLQVVLETMAGTRRVNDACTHLKISEQRFEQLRREILQAALAAVTPKLVGRPSRVVSPEERRWEQAQARIAELETQLRIATVQTELATILPHAAAAEAKSVTASLTVPVEATRVEPGPRTPTPTTRRGRQHRRRQDYERQLQVRHHAASLADELLGHAYTLTEIAAMFGITPRTLRTWQKHHMWVDVHTPLPGRPAACASREQRNDVIHYLDEYGPGVGLLVLRDAFPQMIRAELDDLLTRYRRVWRQRHRQPLHVLHWTTPGTVWAIDFAEAPAPVDGLSKYLLAVRDLASGQQLLWQPVPEPTAAVAAEALAYLFLLHGPPLVLKSDNGSTFGAPAVTAVLHDFRVLALFSPPGTPSYNGSIEAGIGALKERTAAHAARQGRLNHWTWDDLAAARLEANATARPQGQKEPTPDEAWAMRSPIPHEQPTSFQATVEGHRATARQELDLSPTDQLPPMTERQVDRIAIRRALVEHGVLYFTRKQILPTIKRRKAEVVS